MVVCTKCGVELRPTDKFCSACGAAAPAPVQETSSSLAPSDGGSKAGLILIGGIVLILVLMISINISPQTSPASPATKDINAASVDDAANQVAAEADKALADAQKALGQTSDTKSRSNWSYSRTEDEVRGGEVATASVTSSNSIELDFPYQGGSTVRMTVRKHPEWGLDVFFVLSSGQLICRSYNGCAAAVRFDDGPTQKFSMTEASDNSSDTVFVSNDSRFLDNLKRSKKVVVELEIYEAGRQQFKFDTVNLEWPPP